VFGFDAQLKIFLCAVGNNFTQKFRELRGVFGFLKSVALVGVRDLRIALAFGNAAHGKVHADLAAFPVKVRLQVFDNVLFNALGNSDHVFGGKSPSRGLVLELGSRRLTLGTRRGGLVSGIHVTTHCTNPFFHNSDTSNKYFERPGRHFLLCLRFFAVSAHTVKNGFAVINVKSLDAGMQTGNAAQGLRVGAEDIAYLAAAYAYKVRMGLRAGVKAFFSVYNSYRYNRPFFHKKVDIPVHRAQRKAGYPGPQFLVYSLRAGVGCRRAHGPQYSLAFFAMFCPHFLYTNSLNQ
jgi:hypothetical protein